jgi:hypothetical protein
MDKRGSVELIIPGLVAVIALVGLILLFKTGVTGNAMAPTGCVDSDGGKNYGVLGKTTITGANRMNSQQDTCSSVPSAVQTGIGAASGAYLIERYCEGANAMSAVYACPGQCINGICM